MVNSQVWEELAKGSKTRDKVDEAKEVWILWWQIQGWERKSIWKGRNDHQSATVNANG